MIYSAISCGLVRRPAVPVVGFPFAGSPISALVASLFSAGEKGVVFDFSNLSNLWQDTARTTPCTAAGQAIAAATDLSGNNAHATQATSTKRPLLASWPKVGRRNMLINTATLSTQSVPVVNRAYTLQFTGSGTVTLSGASTAGPLVGGGTLTFTPASFGTLTLTVIGSVTAAQLEPGSTATAVQTVGAAHTITETGKTNVYTALFDGVDDCLVTPSINCTAFSEMLFSVGVNRLTDASIPVVLESSANSNSNVGSFFLTTNNTANTTTTRALFQGTLPSAPNYSSGKSPVPVIVTAAASISAPLAIIRENGVLKQSLTTTMGTVKFGNYPIYIGQRAEASLPFSGGISAIVIRSSAAATSAGDISKIEAVIAARTPGATL